MVIYAASPPYKCGCSLNIGIQGNDSETGFRSGLGTGPDRLLPDPSVYCSILPGPLGHPLAAWPGFFISKRLWQRGGVYGRRLSPAEPQKPARWGRPALQLVRQPVGPGMAPRPSMRGGQECRAMARPSGVRSASVTMRMVWRRRSDRLRVRLFRARPGPELPRRRSNLVGTRSRSRSCAGGERPRVARRAHGPLPGRGPRGRAGCFEARGWGSGHDPAG